MEQRVVRTFPLFFLNAVESITPKRESEKILWSYLNQKPLGFEFSQQQPIHYFITDFLCVELHFVIEIKAGNHEKPELSERDITRETWLAENGFAILRFTDFEIEHAIEKVILTIENKIKLISAGLQLR